MRILIVEDDALLADGLTQTLRQRGHVADCVASGEEAQTVESRQVFDIVILDVGLPGMDGFELLRRWRSAGVNVPVIVLTARDALVDRVIGLNLGADDYLAKPFATDELLARMTAIVRRSRNVASNRIEFGPVVLNLDARIAFLNGVQLPIPPREWAILELFAVNAGRIVTKNQIVDAVCTWDDDLSPNAVEIYVSRLRNKLKPSGLLIHTVRGFGYLLKNLNESSALL